MQLSREGHARVQTGQLLQRGGLHDFGGKDQNPFVPKINVLCAGGETFNGEVQHSLEIHVYVRCPNFQIGGTHLESLR